VGKPARSIFVWNILSPWNISVVTCVCTVFIYICTELLDFFQKMDADLEPSQIGRCRKVSRNGRKGLLRDKNLVTSKSDIVPDPPFCVKPPQQVNHTIPVKRTKRHGCDDHAFVPGCDSPPKTDNGDIPLTGHRLGPNEAGKGVTWRLRGVRGYAAMLAIP
jgi:hypothetical protein